MPYPARSRSFPKSAKGAGKLQYEVADARDATVPANLIDRYEPGSIILVAGATPHMRPLQQQTWETFSVSWDTDVRVTFNWLREALLTPLPSGSRVVVISSGAALGGSPLSGGYAGAKATQRFMTGYAQDEAERAGLDITFTSVLPQFAPLTGVGQVRGPSVRSSRGRTLGGIPSDPALPTAHFGGSRNQHGGVDAGGCLRYLRLVCAERGRSARTARTQIGCSPYTHE